MNRSANFAGHDAKERLASAMTKHIHEVLSKNQLLYQSRAFKSGLDLPTLTQYED